MWKRYFFFIVIYASSLSYIQRNDQWGKTTSDSKRLVGAKRLGGKRLGGKRLAGETTRGGNGLGAKPPGFKGKSKLPNGANPDDPIV